MHFPKKLKPQQYPQALQPEHTKKIIQKLIIQLIIPFRKNLIMITASIPIPIPTVLAS
jgi:hypothetical protein